MIERSLDDWKKIGLLKEGWIIDKRLNYGDLGR